MADQRSAFRFRFPWLPAASAPRPTTPRPPAQPTASTIPAPAPWRAAETQVPSQLTSITTPTPGQSTGSATPAPAPQRTAETEVPSQPTSTTTRILTPQSVDTETPTQPTTGTATTTMTTQIQSSTTTIPSSATPQKAETEAPSPSFATKTPILENTRTDQTQPPSQATAPTTPIPASAQTAQTQPPSQPTATTTATITTSERPPFRPPGATSPQAPLPQPQASRTESQPSSPSRVTSQSQVSSRSASPSRATQSQYSQPSTPSRAASQSPATPLLSSPSSKKSPNSPTPQTASQPRSQPRMASRPAGQTSSSSPSSKAAHGQPTAATLIESTSPSKGKQRLSSNSFKPSSSSNDNTSSVLEKELKSTVSEQQSLEKLQPKEETKLGMIYDSQKQTPVETSTETNEIALQRLEESGKRTITTSTPTRGPQASVPTKKSQTPTKSSEPESFQEDSKPKETKEVKEIMQETKEKTYREAIDKDDYLLTSGPASAVQTKEQLSFTYQSEQAQQAVHQKEVMPTFASNGKEAKTTAQPRNKTVSAESRQKLAMTNGEHIPQRKEMRDDISKLVQKMAAGDHKQSIDDRRVSVITLAGENRGATMHLGTDSMKKGGAVPIRRGYKVNPDENAETTTDGEGSFKVKSEDTKDIEDQAAETFVNSNVQGINNSIMFNSSITERSPGVHLVHSHSPRKLKTSTAEKEFLEREKTEFSTTHAQRLTYEPMVRRRCLRGLFLESSDSDPENTTKPRRHGCRVGCKGEE